MAELRREYDQWMGDVRMVPGHTVLKSGMGVHATERVERPRGVLRSMWTHAGHQGRILGSMWTHAGHQGRILGSMWTHAEGQGEVLGGAWVRVETPQENTEKHVDTRRIAGRSTRRCTGAGGNTPGEY